MNHASMRTTVFLASLVAAATALAEGSSYPSSPGSTGGYGPGSTSAPPPGASTPMPGTSAPASGSPGMSTSRPAGGQDESPIVIVAPAWYANDPNLANGCWARLYDKTDFRGTVFPIVGPVSIPNNKAGFVTGFEMGRNYDSVMLGSRATLTVWDGADYRNRSTTFQAGQAIPDLDKRMGATEEIRSMKVTCSQ
jgi:hypothetical protein